MSKRMCKRLFALVTVCLGERQCMIVLGYGQFHSLSNINMPYNPLGGVEVGESIVHAVDGQWKRVYRIRLLFEDPVKIRETFGVSFEVSTHAYMCSCVVSMTSCCV